MSAKSFNGDGISPWSNVKAYFLKQGPYSFDQVTEFFAEWLVMNQYKHLLCAARICLENGTFSREKIFRDISFGRSRDSAIPMSFYSDLDDKALSVIWLDIAVNWENFPSSLPKCISRVVFSVYLETISPDEGKVLSRLYREDMGQETQEDKARKSLRIDLDTVLTRENEEAWDLALKRGFIKKVSKDVDESIDIVLDALDQLPYEDLEEWIRLVNKQRTQVKPQSAKRAATKKTTIKKATTKKISRKAL